jgi:hypothetical protein
LPGCGGQLGVGEALVDVASMAAETAAALEVPLNLRTDRKLDTQLK